MWLKTRGAAAKIGASGAWPAAARRIHRPRLPPRSSTCSPSAPRVLLDGTLAKCDRVGASRADYSHKHRQYGVNVQEVTDPDGRLLWLTPADERQDVPILAGLAAQGGGPLLPTGIKRRSLLQLSPTGGTVNRALAQQIG